MMKTFSEKVRLKVLYDEVEKTQDLEQSQAVSISFEKVINICEISQKDKMKFLGNALSSVLFKGSIDIQKQALNIESMQPRIMR